MKKDEKIRREALDELLAGYTKPEELMGPEGLLRQLTGALVERALQAELTRRGGDCRRRAIGAPPARGQAWLARISR
jgi:putative transposase